MSHSKLKQSTGLTSGLVLMTFWSMDLYDRAAYIFEDGISWFYLSTRKW